MERLVVVNRRDQILGEKEKLACHQKPETLHRGFAAFVLDKKNRILMSKRSRKKPLWPLFWDNTCCSHPGPREGYVTAGEQRLVFELGFSTPLRYIYKFRYQADYDAVLSEYEICAVLVGRYSGLVKLNPNEVCESRWLEFSALRREIARHPSLFTPWLKMIVKKIHESRRLREQFFH